MDSKDRKDAHAWVLSEIYVYFAFFHVLIFGLLGLAFGVHLKIFSAWTAAGGVVVLLVVFFLAFSHLKGYLAKKRAVKQPIVVQEAVASPAERVLPPLGVPAVPNVLEDLSEIGTVVSQGKKRPKRRSPDSKEKQPKNKNNGRSFAKDKKIGLKK